VQLERRLTELRGSGAGYSAIASDLFAAVRATANAELTALIFEPDGTLRATIQGDSPATLDALRQRVEGSGYAVDLGALRSGGGRPTAELTVRVR
jgi:general secretion pathway protein L